MNLDWQSVIIEVIGWSSTLSFLVSIVLPKRQSLHALGVFTAITTGVYGYAHGATAIWVKWLIAFFFHLSMWRKLKKAAAPTEVHTANTEP